MKLFINMNLGVCAAYYYLNIDIPVFLECYVNVLNGNVWWCGVLQRELK